MVLVNRTLSKTKKMFLITISISFLLLLLGLSFFIFNIYIQSVTGQQANGGSANGGIAISGSNIGGSANCYGSCYFYGEVLLLMAALLMVEML